MDLVQAMSGKQPTKSPFQTTAKQSIPKRPNNTQRLTDDDAKRVRTEHRGSVSPPYSKYSTSTSVYPSNRQTSSSTTTPLSSPKHVNATITTIATSSSHNNNNPTITTPHNYNVVSPTQNIISSNLNVIPPNHNNIPSPSHNNITSPIHKNSVANVPYKHDIPNRPPLWQGQIKKKSKPIIGVKLELVYDPWKLVSDAL